MFTIIRWLINIKAGRLCLFNREIVVHANRIKIWAAECPGIRIFVCLLGLYSVDSGKVKTHNHDVASLPCVAVVWVSYIVLCNLWHAGMNQLIDINSWKSEILTGSWQVPWIMNDLLPMCHTGQSKLKECKSYCEWNRIMRLLAWIYWSAISYIPLCDLAKSSALILKNCLKENWIKVSYFMTILS